MEVREESAFGVEGDGVGVGTSAAPEDRLAIVGEVEVIGPPVDEGVGGSQPRFPENEIVVGEWVNEGIEVVGVVVASDGEGASGGRDGGGTVGKNDGNGGTRDAWERVLFSKRRRDHVALRTTID